MSIVIGVVALLVLITVVFYLVHRNGQAQQRDRVLGALQVERRASLHWQASTATTGSIHTGSSKPTPGPAAATVSNAAFEPRARPPQQAAPRGAGPRANPSPPPHGSRHAGAGGGAGGGSASHGASTVVQRGVVSSGYYEKEHQTSIGAGYGDYAEPSEQDLPAAAGYVEDRELLAQRGTASGADYASSTPLTAAGDYGAAGTPGGYEATPLTLARSGAAYVVQCRALKKSTQINMWAASLILSSVVTCLAPSQRGLGAAARQIAGLTAVDRRLAWPCAGALCRSTGCPSPHRPTTTSAMVMTIRVVARIRVAAQVLAPAPPSCTARPGRLTWLGRPHAWTVLCITRRLRFSTSRPAS